MQAVPGPQHHGVPGDAGTLTTQNAVLPGTSPAPSPDLLEREVAEFLASLPNGGSSSPSTVPPPSAPAPARPIAARLPPMHFPPRPPSAPFLAPGPTPGHLVRLVVPMHADRASGIGEGAVLGTSADSAAPTFIRIGDWAERTADSEGKVSEGWDIGMMIPAEDFLFNPPCSVSRL